MDSTEMTNKPENTNAAPESKYWMSLDQWRQDPEFAKLAEREFLSSPLQSDDGKDGWARREFLKLMGASIALTSFGCVRRPAQKIIPYAKKPAEVVHGIPNFYASSYQDGMEGLGILVTTRDGRPIKIEGNPDHPANLGTMSARAHASILKLYDPDRFTSAKRNLQNETRSNRETINVKWEDLDKAVVEQLQKGRAAMLLGTEMSPSTTSLMDEFAQSFNIQLYQYDDLPYDSMAEAQKLAYGERALPVLHFDKARLVVAINTDFMGTWYEPVRFQRDFMSVRKKRDQDINRLVVFESLLTLTGSNADQRYRIRPSQSLAIVMGLLNEIVVTRKASRYAHDDSVLRVISAFAKGSADLGLNLGELAEELIHNKGRSLVVTGGPLSDTEEAVALQVATSFLNAVLENDGHTIDPASSRIPGQRGQGIGELLAAIKAGQIKTLIVHRCNPVYTMPAGSPLREALAGLEMIIYTGDRNDETARYADYIATDHHALENWSDMRTPTGVLSIQQPTIQPLYRTRAFQDSLISWMKTADRGPARVKGAENWYEYLRQNWRDQLAPKVADRSFDDLWNEILEKGVVAGSATPAASRTFSVAALATVKPTARKTGFELTLYPTVALRDGSLANVSWLQELPDPVTKATWDNYVMVSPRDAAQLKLKEGQHVTLTVDGRTLTVPAHIQPGLADGAIGVALGYGRVGAGQVADGVGQNAYTLARWADGRRVFAGLETSVKVESKVTPLAITQGHHTMEGRQIVVEETLADFLAKPGGGIHRHPSGPKYEMWGGEKGHKYVGNKWGMVVDLNTCTGCSACVIACQSENNIPTVGKRYVIEGREMHWLRIDRYYTGTPEDPDTVHQPMLCQHCENAPCEVVCPVAATVHSDEGTNDMIYNRCVGTRYCSNNCPYKVRRFNWFDFTQYESPRHLALNPEVTVRNRGVMEKCTFCIHRIRYHKSQAKLEDRPLKADEFTTACAQACPTNAIIFGDLNNQESAVAQEFNKPYSYSVLSELNTKPVLHYQVSIRNAEHLKGAPKHREEGHHS